MILLRSQRIFQNMNNFIFTRATYCSSKARTRKSKDEESIKRKLKLKALNHFDRFYKPYYPDIWKSMRIALLSQPKDCAVINNFACREDATADLMANGTDNIIFLSRHAEVNMQENERSTIKENELSVMTVEQSPPLIELHTGEDDVEYDIPPGHDVRLYSFMPAQRVLSEAEDISQKELQQNILNPHGQEIFVTGDDEKPLPQSLQVFTHPMGEVGRFPEPDLDETGKLAYYVMDAGAVIPVLALGISPGDHVLDLCAGSGEKAMAIVQTLLTESLTCVDHSYSLLRELKKTMKWYLPDSFIKDEKLKIIHSDALHIPNKPAHFEKYDKVLVDVPCFSDRESLKTAEEKLFSHAHQDVRISLQDTQAKLLIAGIKCCKPGGSIVYSTSTLSPPQNEGIIQKVLEHFQNEEDLKDFKLAIQNTNNLCNRLSSFLHFYDKCRFGQLVVPKLTANFGPTYFCKLKRLK